MSLLASHSTPLAHHRDPPSNGSPNRPSLSTERTESNLTSPTPTGPQGYSPTTGTCVIPSDGGPRTTIPTRCEWRATTLPPAKVNPVPLPNSTRIRVAVSHPTSEVHLELRERPGFHEHREREAALHPEQRAIELFPLLHDVIPGCHLQIPVESSAQLRSNSTAISGADRFRQETQVQRPALSTLHCVSLADWLELWVPVV